MENPSKYIRIEDLAFGTEIDPKHIDALLRIQYNINNNNIR